MLAVSSLRNFNDEDQGQIESFSMDANDFPDFSDRNLLDSIDFDDLFLGINDGDVLPDLEMNPKILAKFSVSEGEESSLNPSRSGEKSEADTKKEDEDKVSVSGSGFNSSSSLGEEILSKRDESDVVKGPPKEAGKGRRSSSRSKNSQGKRKVKVDWTPELHGRFVQAVEQLGAYKAVPSRILEVMGVDGLTRHNIASHLQKYRSHRKHLQACGAEAASCTQRRQMYGAALVGGGMTEISPWLAPTMGFPPPVTPMHHFRPLHVWGHPPTDQTLMPLWPKHLAHSSPSPPPAMLIPAPLQPSNPSYWRPNHQRVPRAVTPGAPCFPSARLASALAPAIPPHTMYEVDPGVGVPTRKSGPHPPLDVHPMKESVDAVIGDVLSKPWLPFPIGLKPPSPESVTEELQRLGIRKMPPSFA